MPKTSETSDWPIYNIDSVRVPHTSRQYQEALRSCRLRQAEEAEKLRQGFEDRVAEMEKRYRYRFRYYIAHVYEYLK